MLKVGTFCSGIGSPEQALKNLNIDHSVEFACELDKFARETYKANFKPKHFYNDLTSLNYNDLPDVDLFVAGFPCQAFSIAGKRKGFADETRGTIFFNIYEYLKIKQPDIFILENVKGLLSHDSGNTFKTIIDLLGQSANGQGFLFPHNDSLGYHLFYKVLNTKNVGNPEPLPQNRERIFIIGFKKFRSFNFPEKQELKLKLKNLLESDDSEKYYLTNEKMKQLIDKIGIIKESTALTIARTEEAKKQRAENLKKGRDYSSFSESKLTPRNDSLMGALYASPNPTKDNLIIDVSTVSFNRLTGINKKIDIAYCLESSGSRGLNRNQNQNAVLITEPQPITNPDFLNKNQNGRRFKNPGENMFTLTATDRHGIFYRNRIRRLTPLECFRLMGFPDNFEKPVSSRQLYKQAGNSIAVPTIQAVLKKIYP